jgi:hypothetical protein
MSLVRMKKMENREINDLLNSVPPSSIGVKNTVFICGPELTLPYFVLAQALSTIDAFVLFCFCFLC